MSFKNLLIGLFCSGSTLVFGQNPTQFVNDGRLNESTEGVVDAEIFVNNGLVIFESITPFPFDTQNTLAYTNNGIMNHPAGFVFEHIDNQGRRSPAHSFFNGVNGSIGASFPPYGFDEVETNIVYFTDNRITVSANEVANQGLISVGSSGLIDLHGAHLDLSDGGLMVETVQNAFDSVSFGTNFVPSTGIFDNYWGGLTNSTRDFSGLLNVVGTAANITSPSHIITNIINGFGFGNVIGLQNADFSIVSNALTETNIIVQAVFSSTPPSIGTQIRFTPSERTNEIATATIEYTASLPNPVTGSEDVMTVYLQDTLAWATNLVFEQNLLTGNSLKPSTYNIYRNPPIEWFLGAPGLGELSPDLLYNSTFSNTVVTNYHAAYSTYVSPSADNVRYEPSSSIPAREYISGAIELETDVLDLRNARIKGNFLDIKADHLIGGSVDSIHAAHANYQLSSTNSVLDFASVVPDTVPNFSGDLKAYSAIWTNLSGIIITNPPADENSEETYTTNVVEYFYHVLMVDGVSGWEQSGLKTTTPSIIHDLALTAPEEVVIGNALVDQSFHVDSPSLSIDGDLLLEGRIQDLKSQQVSSVRNFTVNGSLSVNDEIELGTGEHGPLESFVNHGNVFSRTHRILSDYVENRGEINAGSTVTIEADTVKLQSGTIAGKGVSISAKHLKMHDSTLPATDRLNILSSFVDSGEEANNLITVNNGFFLGSVADNGDLLGTSISSILPWWAEIEHSWAGSDLGKTESGFSNNAALGHLALSGVGNARARFSSPNGTSAALYVDMLEFQGDFAEKWESNLTVDSNFTIYFGGSNLPAEELDGALGGRLQWVPSYAGPRSGVAYTRPDGTVERVNKARLLSGMIDDDGDGIANGLDVEPFEGVLLNGIVFTSTPNPAASLSWTSGPGAKFEVQFKNHILDENWTTLGSVANLSDVAQVLRYDDTGLEEHANRFYRVIFLPGAN